ncbi:potassium channel family protein [Ureaplasma miroungigenitalium]|uniref:Potassium channel family protein n=1 Tax=Ureaplasma miroungigenitalium TaxID=1042321 RepID=A0ABT3BN35_9BACT|nr:potassium channel family protein [Ureaplasma miroungigenitalium]MCV3728638.1 potassium channel family protein [Ureaplasma miroungigenitalium]
MTKEEIKSFRKENKLLYFNRFRFVLFEFTDMQAYSKIMNIKSIVAFFYQLCLMIMVVASSTIIIYNQANLNNTSDPIQETNHHTFIKQYFLIFYIINYVFLFDYFLRWFYADYSQYKWSRIKAFLLFPFRFTSFLDFGSFLIIIIIYHSGLQQTLFSNEFLTDDQVFSDFVNNPVYMDVFPAAILFKILGLHKKIINNTVLASDINVFGEVIKRRWRILLSSIIVILVFAFVLSFIILRCEQDYYHLKNIPYESDKYKFRSLGDSLWFAVGTITTIAYGDLAPVSEQGRFFASIMGVIGVTYYGFLTSLFASGIISVLNESARARTNTKLLQFQSENERLLNDFSIKIIDEFKKYKNKDAEEAEDASVKNEETIILHKQRTSRRHPKLLKGLVDDFQKKNKQVVWNLRKPIKR